MIQVILPKEYNLTLMGAYKVSGLGYDIKEVCSSLRKMVQSQTTRFVHDINTMYKLWEK